MALAWRWRTRQSASAAGGADPPPRPLLPLCPGRACNVAHAGFAPVGKALTWQAPPPWRRATPARRASRCGAACSDAAAAARTPPAARARRGSARARVGVCALARALGSARAAGGRAHFRVCSVAHARAHTAAGCVTGTDRRRGAAGRAAAQVPHPGGACRCLPRRWARLRHDAALTRAARCAEQPQGVLRGCADGDPPSARRHREGEGGQPGAEARARDDCEQGA